MNEWIATKGNDKVVGFLYLCDLWAFITLLQSYIIHNLNIWREQRRDLSSGIKTKSLLKWIFGEQSYKSWNIWRLFWLEGKRKFSENKVIVIMTENNSDKI